MTPCDKRSILKKASLKTNDLCQKISCNILLFTKKWEIRNNWTGWSVGTAWDKRSILYQVPLLTKKWWNSRN